MNRMISPLRYLIFVLTFSFSVVSESKDSIETVDFQNQVSVCNDPLTLQDQPAQQQVAEFFSGIFSTINWPARWYCGTWSPFHGWFSIFSDFMVWFSYFTIPAILYFFLHKRRVPKEFQKTFWLFIAFILCCGLTHLMEVIIFWWPAYRLNTMITFATASVSLFTVIKSFNENIMVSILNDGQEAINHFTDTESPPDLVLLDINMPFINGFEFLDYYAKQNWNGRTKFAIYSTSSRASDIEKSKTYKHVIDYIEKPLNQEKLVRLFEKFQIARQ